jgi:outer membrane scaffolding protein for murein synthesis (MipA/OmpV family)
VKYGALLLGMVVPLGAVAQETLLGAAVRTRPAYDGSATQRTDVVPVVRYYGRPWFARTTQGILEAGARTELAPGFHAGAQLAYEPGRDDPKLNAGVSAGLHLEWDGSLGPLPLTFVLRARQHLDADRGGQADLRVTAGVLARGGLLAGVFAQATWGSENAVQSMYGPPNSGLLFTSAGLLGSFELSRQWLLVGSVERRRLYDEVASSALAEHRSNSHASAGLAYRF